MQLADYIIIFMSGIVIVTLCLSLYHYFSNKYGNINNKARAVSERLSALTKKHWRDVASYTVKLFLVFVAVFFLWTELDFGIARILYAVWRAFTLIIVLCSARVILYIYKQILLKYYNEKSITLFRFSIFYLAIIIYMVFDLDVKLHQVSVILALLLLALSYIGNVVSMFKIVGLVKHAKWDSLKMMWWAIGLHIVTFVIQLTFAAYFIYNYTAVSFVGITENLRVFDFFYYIIMTLSTVGAAKIIPVSDLAYIVSLTAISTSMFFVVFMITLFLAVISSKKNEYQNLNETKNTKEN